MGWASGSELAEELWSKIKNDIPKNNHKKVAKIIYDKFCEHDADAWEYDSKLLEDAKIKFDE
jgi:hypothetical protein